MINVSKKFHFRKLKLRPYPGEVWVFSDLKELRRTYKRMLGEKYPYEDEESGGRFIAVERSAEVKDRVFLVYGRKPHVLAHEFTHVLLVLFSDINCNPASGNGEPFCYMLSQLLLECQDD